MKDDGITYTRRKTGQRLTVRVEPRMKEILIRRGKDAFKTNDQKAAHEQYTGIPMEAVRHIDLVIGYVVFSTASFPIK